MLEIIPVWRTIEHFATVRNDAVAIGLWSRLKRNCFVQVYLLSNVLPTLTKLSKVFQSKTFNFSSPTEHIEEAKRELQCRLSSDVVAEKLKSELEKFFSDMGEWKHQYAEQLNQLSSEYLLSLISSIAERFRNFQPSFNSKWSRNATNSWCSSTEHLAQSIQWRSSIIRYEHWPSEGRLAEFCWANLCQTKWFEYYRESMLVCHQRYPLQRNLPRDFPTRSHCSVVSPHNSWSWTWFRRSQRRENQKKKSVVGWHNQNPTERLHQRW